MKKLKLFFACLLMAVLSIGQVWATDDVINNAATSSALGSTGTTSWKNPDPTIVGASGAEYTIHSMGTSGTTNAIQWNKNGFLYQTKSGGTLKSVTIKGAAKKINIFASNTAYSAKATGTQLAQVTASTSGVTYTFESDYTYLAINGTESSTSITEITVAYQSGGGGSTPSVSLSPSSLDLDAENVANQSVTITASNFASAISSVTTGLYSDAECTSEITSGAWVKNVIVNGEKTAVTFDVDDNNTGVARECWLKVSATDGTGNASAAVHIAQKKIVVDYATLPFSFTGGKADIETTDGMTQSGLGSDYSATEKLKFDNTGDWLKIKINADPGKLSYKIKGNSFSGGTFTIQQSADDETYSDLATYTADGSVELALAKTTRYVKFIYTYKSSGNIGLGNIAISLPVDVEAPTISGVTPFLSSTEVTLTQNDADAIYYTTDEAKKENPSVDTWTEYNSASKPSFNATTTIYAAAIKGSAWSAVAEQTFTKATVLTVAEAIALIPNKDDVVNDQYVAGIVCTAAPSLLSGGKLTYYISADGSETNRLQIYKGKNLNNTEFTAVSDLAIGDRVTVFGQLKNFNNTPEMNDGNYLVSKEGPAVAAPVLNPNGGGFMGETDVTITCETEGSAIYYTLDGTTTPTKSSTPYEAAIHLDATTTIKAIAYVGDDASLVITKTFTLTAPMTVAEALTALDSENPINNVAVAGIISTAPTSNPSSGKLTYYISDDGTATDELEVFLGFGLNGASFSAKTDLQVGDEVTVFGNLTIYNTTKEFASGSRLLAFNRPVVAVTGVDLASTATVKVGKTINLSASVIPANASNKTINWSIISGNENITFDNGAVTGVAEGTAVVRATSDADNTKYAECTITIAAADPTYLYYNYEKVTATADIEDGEYLIVYEGNTDHDAAAFDGSLDNSNIDVAKKVITVEIEDDMIIGTAQLHAATFTIDVTAGTIQSASGLYIGKDANANGLDKSSETAYTNSIEISEGEAVITGKGGCTLRYNYASDQLRFRYYKSGQQPIALYKKVGTNEAPKQDPGISWDPESAELTLNEDITPADYPEPGLIILADLGTNPLESITFSSDNESLATINADGQISWVSKATGTVHFTATFDGNETYKPATAVCTVTINPDPDVPVVLTDYYEKVTSTAGIEEGTYLIVYEEGSLAFNGGLETLDAASNTIEVAITNDNKIGVTPSTEAATFYIEPTAGTIQAANGKYIGVTSNSNGLKTSDAADAYNNTFAIDEDGNAVIAAGFESSTMSLRYNKGSGQERFRYYSNASQQPIALYKLANEVIKPAAGLAWNPAEDITLTVGDAFSAPELQNPNNIDAAEITIASSNESVATVTAGVVELVADATGTATITATFAGNASYKPATVSYKIKVLPANSIYVSSLNVNFGSVAKDATVEDKVITVTLTGVAAATATLAGDGASAFSITPAALTASGDITISASSAIAGTFNATLTISDDDNLAESKDVSLKLTVVDGATEEAAISTSTKWVAATAADLVDGAVVLITGVKSEVVYAMGEQKSTNRAAYAATLNEGVLTPGEGTMAFTLVAQGDGTFAIRTSNGKFLYAAGNGSNHLKTQDEVDVNAKWTLTVASAVAEGSTNRNVMQFNGGSSKLFSCYASASQEDIQFYVPQQEPPVEDWVEVRTGLEVNRHYTVCLEKNITNIDGATFWSLSQRNQDGTLAYLEEEPAPEAGKPYIIQATKATLKVVYGDETAAAPVENGALRGTFDYMDADALAAAGTNIYMLFSNELRPIGSNNHLDAHRAYVLYNELQAVSTDPVPAPGRRVKAMPMQKDAATGVGNVQGNNVQCTKVLINGQLFILRGEKMFDATGRLVK